MAILGNKEQSEIGSAHALRLSRRLRVCVSTYAPGDGGLQSVTSNVCRYLMRLGFEVTPVFLANPVSARRLPSYLWSSRPRREPAWGTEGIALDHFSHLETLQYIIPALKARRTLRGFDVYQVIRGGNLGESFFALSGYPFVDWVGTTIADERRTQTWSDGPRAGWSRFLVAANRATYRLLLRQEGWMLKKAAQVCAVSHYIRDRIVEAHGLPPRDVDVIPNPVDTERFAPEAVAAAPSRDRSLLCVGRLDDPRKNLGLLLDAFARVRRMVPGALLRLVGPLDRQEWLEGRLERLGIAGAVVHLGGVSLDRLVGLYQETDVVVLSSLQEGFGMVLAEAMACGTPVVATRCGGPEDVVKDGETGFLVPCDDAPAVASALHRDGGTASWLLPPFQRYFVVPLGLFVCEILGFLAVAYGCVRYRSLLL